MPAHKNNATLILRFVARHAQCNHNNKPQRMTDTIKSIILELDPNKLDEQTRRDLIANAQLQRKKPEQLLAELFTKKLGGAFIVRAA